MTAICPANDERHSRRSDAESDDGPVVVYWLAECNVGIVIEAMACPRTSCSLGARDLAGGGVP